MPQPVLGTRKHGREVRVEVRTEAICCNGSQGISSSAVCPAVFAYPVCNSVGRQASLGTARVFPETGSAVAGWDVQHPAVSPAAQTAATTVPNRGDGEGKL